MSEFDALGRDVAAAADSTFESAVAGAVKAVWAAAGFDKGENPNHLWTVAVDIQSDRFTVSAAVKDGNVYVPPPYPSVPASVDEIGRQDAVADEPVVVPEAPTAPVDEVPAVAPVEEATAGNADTAVTVTANPADAQITPDQADTAQPEPDAPAA